MTHKEFIAECKKLGVQPQDFGTNRIQVVEIKGQPSVMSERHQGGLVDYEATLKKVLVALGKDKEGAVLQPKDGVAAAGGS